MPYYAATYEYTIREGGVLNLDAPTPEEAKRLALQDIETMYVDIEDINVTDITEIPDGR